MSKNLKLIVPPNFKEFGRRVNNHINVIRDTNENYIATAEFIRFGNGEGKCVLGESVREQDVYILTDVGNYDITYKIQRGYTHHVMPDEHYQDIVRIISAMDGHAKKVTLIMPYLYQGRQDKRTKRESLDCAVALQNLERYGISEIITFDAHNPSVANAIPSRMTFSNGYATSDIILKILDTEHLDIDKLFIISPDEGARGKAKFLADILGGIGYGNFDKRRNYDEMKDGSNPITYHEFVGPSDLKGKDVIIIDDMISSGTSLIDSARKIKEKGANRIYLMVTYALFTKGVDEFDEAFEEGIFDRVYATNLSYVPEEYKLKEWYSDVDCSSRVARVVDNLNKGNSIRSLLDGRVEAFQKVKQYQMRNRNK